MSYISSRRDSKTISRKTALQLHEQKRAELHGQTTVCSHYWESFYYWISVITCWLNTQSNFISWHHSEQEQGLNSSIEQDQGSSESVEIQVFFGYLSILGVLLAVKYQGGISVFKEHKGIIYIFVIVISIYVGTIIVGKKLGPIRLLYATIAPILLFFILLPELGWPALGLWVILAAKLAWDYLRQPYHYLLHQASHVFNSFATLMTRNSTSVEESQEPPI